MSSFTTADSNMVRSVRKIPTIVRGASSPAARSWRTMSHACFGRTAVSGIAPIVGSTYFRRLPGPPHWKVGTIAAELVHALAFQALGGVPREILYDNLKSVVLERVGDHIRFHPRILDLAGYYCFAPKPCAPYRGNEKGKVERLIRYIRDAFFAARRFSSVEDLNAQLARWIAEVAHVRRAPGHADGRAVDDLSPRSSCACCRCRSTRWRAAACSA